MSLLKKGPKHLEWYTAGDEAFKKLKITFTTAPIFKHPVPSMSFIPEVDTVESGVRVVLSLRSREKLKLHLKARYSKKLSPAEVNYDIENQKLLAVKLALEEWCHCLEGTALPFTIVTDLRNLKYLRTTKHLNPHQSRWAPFFTCFNFTLLYR